MPEKPENELTEQARQSIEELKATLRQEVFSEQKRQRRGQLIYAGLGIVIGVAVSAALFQWWDTIAKIQPLLVGVLVVAILALGGAAVAFIWFRVPYFIVFSKSSPRKPTAHRALPASKSLPANRRQVFPCRLCRKGCERPDRRN